MRILDRYVLQKFLLPFVYSFVGFVAIWFIFDLSDNLQDFLTGKADIATLLEYYQSQIPAILIISMPVSCLLALLYSLTAMSRTNEIISMLGAGVSVIRILVPLFLLGIGLVWVTWHFNYESAPKADMIKKQMLRDIKRGKKTDKEPGLVAHLYPNREDNRLWYMRRIVPADNNLMDVTILQKDAKGNIVKEWLAERAQFDTNSKVWTLRASKFKVVKYLEMDADGNILKSELHDRIQIPGWTETPWRIASSVMNPDWMSVPELNDYLKFNGDFPETRLAAYQTQLQYRYALPWVCLLVVLLAAPMGIVYSRRGILGGVATAIALFFSFVFISSLCIALGKGHRIPPGVAAWGPLVFFGLIGCGLLWFRSENRDLPKIPFLS
ncbi:LptF/LptG family permease [soil metagenome]